MQGNVIPPSLSGVDDRLSALIRTHETTIFLTAQGRLLAISLPSTKQSRESWRRSSNGTSKSHLRTGSYSTFQVMRTSIGQMSSTSRLQSDPHPLFDLISQVSIRKIKCWIGWESSYKLVRELVQAVVQEVLQDTVQEARVQRGRGKVVAIFIVAVRLYADADMRKEDCVLLNCAIHASHPIGRASSTDRTHSS